VRRTVIITQPIVPSGGDYRLCLKLFFIAIALLIPGEVLFAQQAAPADTCIDCHRNSTEPKLAAPVQAIQNDVHGSRGLSCVNCHGGDSTQTDKKLAMNPREGFIGKPQPSAVAPFCGKCHSDAAFMKKYNPALRVDQEAEYKTSVHSKRIAEGDSRPATCISCHGHHDVRAVKDTSSPVHPLRVAETCGRCHVDAEYMSGYKIPTDQLPKYMTSVHAEALYKKLDLSAPTCNDCHGNHGAAPPGAASVANVCGTCHVRQSELFQKSPHQPVFDGLGIGDCLACHKNHDIVHPTDMMLGNDKAAVCTACHTEGDGFDAAGRMRLAISSLDEQIRSADEILDRGTRLGMEVSRVKFDLNEARNHLIDARVVVHGVSPDLLDTAVKPGVEIANRAHEQGLQALADAAFRRRGLALSLIVIGLAILAIYLKVRDIERQ
jgi:predicted CXXCH cytochrome family protein